MKKPTIVLLTVLLGGMAQAAFTSYEQAATQAKKNIAAKDYPAAEKDMKEALNLAKSTDQTGKTLVVLGELSYRQMKFASSRIQWNKATLLKGFDVDSKSLARSAIARSYAAEGNTGKSIEEYKALLADDTVDDSIKLLASSQLSEVYVQTQQLDLAHDLLIDTLKGNDDPVWNVVAHIKLGEVLCLQKNYGAALKEFTAASEVVDADPTSKSDAEKQIKLLTPLVKLENEVQDANKPAPLSEADTGIILPDK